MWSRGVDTQRFHPRHRDLQMRTRLSGDQPEKNLLLYAGRLAPEKQVETLLPVLQSRPHLRLALVGDGPARGKLESLFADTGTVFTGYLRGTDLSQAYASADCFVFPSTVAGVRRDPNGRGHAGQSRLAEIHRCGGVE